MKITIQTYAFILLLFLSGCADMTARDWAKLGLQTTVGAVTYAALGTDCSDFSELFLDGFVANAAMDTTGELIDIAEESSKKSNLKNQQENNEHPDQADYGKPTRTLNASDNLEAGITVLTRYDVNLLSKKSFNSTIVANVPASADVIITGDYGDWIGTKYRDYNGYLAKRWIKKADISESKNIPHNNSNPKTIRTRYATKLYSQPTSSSNTIETLPANEELHVIEQSELFSKVSHNNNIGYVDRRWSW